MSDAVTLPSARTPVVTIDDKGIMTFSRAWFLFLQGLWLKTGGATGSGSLPSMSGETILGNATTVTATPTDLTGAAVTALLTAFTATLQGLVPASGGGISNYLRADGSWATPAGGGGGGGLSFAQLGALVSVRA